VNFAPGHPCRPATAALRWGSAPDAAAIVAEYGPPDLVLGADVVYRHENLDPLLASIAALGPRCALLGVVPRDGIMRALLNRLKQLSWHVEGCGIDGKVSLLRLWPFQCPRCREKPPALAQLTAPGLPAFDTGLGLGLAAAAAGAPHVPWSLDRWAHRGAAPVA